MTATVSHQTSVAQTDTATGKRLVLLRNGRKLLHRNLSRGLTPPAWDSGNIARLIADTRLRQGDAIITGVNLTQEQLRDHVGGRFSSPETAGTLAAIIIYGAYDPDAAAATWSKIPLGGDGPVLHVLSLDFFRSLKSIGNGLCWGFGLVSIAAFGAIIDYDLLGLHLGRGISSRFNYIIAAVDTREPDSPSLEPMLVAYRSPDETFPCV